MTVYTQTIMNINADLVGVDMGNHDGIGYREFTIELAMCPICDRKFDDVHSDVIEAAFRESTNRLDGMANPVMEHLSLIEVTHNTRHNAKCQYDLFYEVVIQRV